MLDDLTGNGRLLDPTEPSILPHENPCAGKMTRHGLSLGPAESQWSHAPSSLCKEAADTIVTASASEMPAIEDYSLTGVLFCLLFETER